MILRVCHPVECRSWLHRFILIIGVVWATACSTPLGSVHVQNEQIQTGSPLTTELYYDGNPESVVLRDAGIAFAISQGVTSPDQIQEFMNTVLDIPVNPDQIIGASADPLSITEFDGDEVPGTVVDAAILFALVGLGGSGSPEEVEDELDELGIPVDLDDTSPIPGPTSTPFSGTVVLDPAITDTLTGELGISIQLDDFTTETFEVLGVNASQDPTVAQFSRLLADGQPPFAGFTYYASASVDDALITLPQLMVLNIPNLPVDACVIVHPVGMDPAPIPNRLAQSEGCV